MKALTICQPFAHLIAIGEKRVENRTWPTSYRGPLAIHAGKGTQYLQPGDELKWPGMVFGAVVAVAGLIECVRLGEFDLPVFGRSRKSMQNIDRLIARRPELEWLSSHKHVEGPWCWVLGEIEPVTPPIPCRGQRGLFEIELPVI